MLPFNATSSVVDLLVCIKILCFMPLSHAWPDLVHNGVAKYASCCRK